MADDEMKEGLSRTLAEEVGSRCIRRSPLDTSNVTPVRVINRSLIHFLLTTTTLFCSARTSSFILFLHCTIGCQVRVFVAFVVESISVI